MINNKLAIITIDLLLSKVDKSMQHITFICQA